MTTEVIMTSCSDYAAVDQGGLQEAISNDVGHGNLMRPKVLSTYGMIPLILGHCIRTILDSNLGEDFPNPGLLHVYETAVANVVSGTMAS